MISIVEGFITWDPIPYCNIKIFESSWPLTLRPPYGPKIKPFDPKK